jgi:hypothetical protein
MNSKDKELLIDPSLIRFAGKGALHAKAARRL